MRIVLLSQFWPPEIGAASVRMSEIAARLAGMGDDVAAITALPNYPSGRIPQAYRSGRSRDEIWRGVNVHRAWVFATPAVGAGRRILNHLSFAAASVPRALRAGRPDVVVANSPPLFVAAAAVILGLAWRVPVVLIVADLHPEAAIALGMLRGGPINRVAGWLADISYRRAAGIVALTEGVAIGIRARGVPAGKVRVIRSGSDVDRFRPSETSAWRARNGFQDDFVALYAGTFGSSQGVYTLRDAPAHLAGTTRLRIVLVGDGPFREELSARADDVLRVMPPEPPDAMPDVIAGADVCLVTLRDLPHHSGALPGKLFEAMAAGKPVILSAPDGEAARLVRESGCGIVVPPEDPGALARAVAELGADPERVRVLGAAGRAAAVRALSREAAATRIRDYLAEVAEA